MHKEYFNSWISGVNGGLGAEASLTEAYGGEDHDMTVPCNYSHNSIACAA